MPHMNVEPHRQRALIACDKFKGSLSAIDACLAVQRGLGEAWLSDICPIADGGEGFVDTMITALHGETITAPAHDALGRGISAEYGIARRGGQTIAIIEMAAASGMWRIDPLERDVMRASTFGTGELMRHAIENHQIDQIIVGLGGSATNDGGTGMAAALGVRFFDADDHLLDPVPESLQRVTRVDFSQRIALPSVQVACDVENPLCGERGASAIYGPQKGASPSQVEELDRWLSHLTQVTDADVPAHTPGAGAAGGLGFGLLTFAGAHLVSGFSLVAQVCDLQQRIAAADLVITGEGSLDAQSLSGKGPVGIARLCRAMGVPCVAVAGACSEEITTSGLFHHAISLNSLGLPLSETMAQAVKLLENEVCLAREQWRLIAGQGASRMDSGS
jgi:glycerate kinase